MRMKKIFLVMAAMLCIATVSAQNKLEQGVDKLVKTAAAQKWSVGLRAGTGLQAVAECFYAGDKYFEGRLGAGLLDGWGADFTVLHNWNCCNWDWTPSAGDWYLDAGVGANVGGHGKAFWCGVVGQAKFGIKFKEVPIRLAVDVSPSIGAVNKEKERPVQKSTTNNGVTEIVETTETYREWGFNPLGLASVAISATWCF